MRKNECANPGCKKKFGLICHPWNGNRYCCARCKKDHSEEELRQRYVRWLQWLRLVP